MKICINNWVISHSDIGEINATVPCTVLSTLVDKKVFFHPYKNVEEKIRNDYLKKDYIFTSHFELNSEHDTARTPSSVVPEYFNIPLSFFVSSVFKSAALGLSILSMRSKYFIFD